MRFNNVAAAALLCLVSASPMVAQSGPAELPPSDFSGQQYVDSRGCVFLRAGYGGQVQWVQRINSARQPLCGYPPTFGAVVIEMADETASAPAAPAVEAKPVVVAQPVVAAPPVVRVAAPVVQQPAARVAAAATGPGPGQIGCYKSAPVPMRVRLIDGGTVVVCTKGDGTMNGWRPPVYPAGAPVGASLNIPRVAGYQMTTGGQVLPTTRAAAAAVAIPAIPEGYVAASNASRLNPQRGVGTVAGQAQQDQIWTRAVPAQEVAAAQPAKPAARTSASTSGNPTAATGSLYVAVGTFGVAANAAGVVATLQSLGLPAAKSQMTRNGKQLQVVYAGPFASTSAAQAALAAARGAGFSDAFIR